MPVSIHCFHRCPAGKIVSNLDADAPVGLNWMWHMKRKSSVSMPFTPYLGANACLKTSGLTGIPTAMTTATSLRLWPIGDLTTNMSSTWLGIIIAAIT